MWFGWCFCIKPMGERLQSCWTTWNILSKLFHSIWIRLHNIQFFLVCAPFVLSLFHGIYNSLMILNQLAYDSDCFVDIRWKRWSRNERTTTRTQLWAEVTDSFINRQSVKMHETPYIWVLNRMMEMTVKTFFFFHAYDKWAMRRILFKQLTFFCRCFFSLAVIYWYCIIMCQFVFFTRVSHSSAIVLLAEVHNMCKLCIFQNLNKSRTIETETV